MLVHDDALILATHGRGFWMLDNIEPLRQLTPDAGTKNVVLFTPASAWRMEGGRGFGGGGGARTEGTNPPNGVIVDFLLKDQKPGTKVSLAFLGPDGKVLRELKGEVQAEAPKPVELKGGTPPPPTTPPSEGVKSEGGTAEQQPTAEAASGEEEESGGRRGRDSDKLEGVTNGHNRMSWNLRAPEAKRFPGLVMWAGGTTGPRVVPGTYTVKLTVGDQPAQTATFDVKQDPRTQLSAADLKAQYDFVMSVHDKLSQVNESITKIRDVRRSLTDIKKRAGDNKAVATAANDLDKKMTAIEEALYQTKNHSPEDPLNFPIKLNDKLAGVGDSAATGSNPPTAQQIAVRDELVAQIDAQLAQLKAIWDTDLPAFNKLVSDQKVPAIVSK